MPAVPERSPYPQYTPRVTGLTPAAKPGRVKAGALAAVAAGNALEWYDWSVYAFAAPMFAHAFFPKGQPAAALMAALATFAVAFLARPVGAALLGRLTDRCGRRAGMTVSVAIMGVASVLIAIVPTYGTIGVAAPLALLVLRCAQGASSGGEIGATAAYLAETAPAERRGWYSAVFQQSTVLGTLVAALAATGLSAVLSKDEMHAFGWRILFAAGGLAGIAAIVLRRKLAESFLFTAQDGADRPLRTLLREHRRPALRIAAITLAPTIVFYTWVLQLPGLAMTEGGLSAGRALAANSIAQATMFVAVPVAGRLSDRFGRRPLLLTFAAATVVIAVPALAVPPHSFGALLVVEIAGLWAFAGYGAIAATVMAEQYPTALVRSAGIAIPYALVVAVFGGTAPLLDAVLAHNGQGAWFGVYVALAAVVSFAAYARMPETNAVRLR
ncbi:MFS transporter [Actinomadura rupiterrae]|uniref:MFS transporter n=1 Tax=Actinomadura rupiterrae TaxID=559627 RepID=UPI0020A29D59|nr:MFS transporter [Actinomadura rupiterrae]MCP2338096.1 MHS family alpha-ketoglutarate permease-like MFS transporter [Actinomadura rupiterrae]